MSAKKPPSTPPHTLSTEGLTAPPPADAGPLAGRMFAHYQIESLLGQGGMGVVYRAKDTRLGRAVALKLLPSEVTADPDRKRRLLQEARAAAAVNHPALTQIYDVGEAEAGVFIAMELVEGRSVETLIASHELDLLGALEVSLQVAGGLQKAHQAGIVHRDVKPSNLMVTPDGHAKLLDFGLAKITAGKVVDADGVSRQLTLSRTEPGALVGTLNYMSPEQARGLSVDHRSDIFSLGVVIFQMITGRLPFAGATGLDVLHSIAYEAPPSLVELRPDMPPSLERAVSRCLAKSVDERYASCSDLITELKYARREVESGQSGQRPLLSRVGERIRAIPTRERALTVALAAVVLIAGWLLMRGSGMPTLFAFGMLGLLAWRRIRHQPQRLARGFTRKARSLPEVKIIAIDGRRLTVVTQGAVAKTYVRLNAILENVNTSAFFGEPFTLAIRDSDTPPSPQSLAALSGGILYAREER